MSLEFSVFLKFPIDAMPITGKCGEVIMALKWLLGLSVEADEVVSVEADEVLSLEIIGEELHAD